MEILSPEMLAGLLAVGLVAGAVASIAGFGIGSLLTPLVALSLPTDQAVALIAIPHFLGTALRLWMWRAHIDRQVLKGFGLMSAAGGLVGALLHGPFPPGVFTGVFAVLLLFAGVSGITGWSDRFVFRGKAAWVAGGLSGLFGGLVGNQGGIRAAAMLGLGVGREAFVATATAIALAVDLARLPVYAAIHGSTMVSHPLAIGAATAGVVLGTLAGGPLLRGIPRHRFRQVVSVLLLALGAWMLLRGFK